MAQKNVPCVHNYKRMNADEEVLFQPDDERKALSNEMHITTGYVSFKREEKPDMYKNKHRFF